MQLTAALKSGGYEVEDFGAHELVKGDDYPDFVMPLPGPVARGEIVRGLAICGAKINRPAALVWTAASISIPPLNAPALERTHLWLARVCSAHAA